jgi:nitrogen fixation/metabolism regulation signal transduction histidine kinase
VSAAASFLLYALPDPEHSIAARALLVIGYVAAAWLWWRVGRQNRTSEDFFWWQIGATLLFLLAVNKMFNLRLLSEAGIRAIAKAGHWYERRQPVQFIVAIILPLVMAILTTVFVVTKGKSFFKRHRLALSGWVLLLSYLALRQSQEWKPALAWLQKLHYTDWRLALEAGGIALVLLSSLLSSNRSNAL